MADLKVKSKLRAQGGIALPAEAASRALQLDGSGNVVASAVTSTELGYLSGVTSSIQTQIGDVATDVADLVILSGVAANETDLGTFTGSIIPNDSDIKEALQALETEIEALPNPIFYAGTYDATTNTPDLDDAGARVQGALYRVTVAGTHDFGAFGGSISFNIGDKAVYNGTAFEKWDVTDEVISVFGRTGAVVAQSGDYTASEVTNVPAGTIAATTVQGAIDELEGDVVAAQADIDNHISDATDAHDASAISSVPAGNLAATDVQAALNELQSDIDTRALASALTDHINDASDAHDASAILVVPAGNLTSTNVQAALEEIQTELDNFNPGSAGDISETSFSIANNQASAANVTGLAFAAAGVRGFEALATVEIDATLDLYETFTLIGINKAGSFDMAVSAVGDESGIVFTITTAGQVQYTSASYAGFVSGAIKFRAITTTV